MKTNITICLDIEVVEKLQLLRKTDDINISGLINKLVIEYLSVKRN